ncbi:hypothetical protein K474DRAFT_1280111 [Panus rudis PR-1116 ss-1]|nr:hypothetical protein K474DRAFT_1280111 [Panus rudis PR-1116 ss-1]
MNGPVALEYIQQVLEILKWGNTGPWRNVPVEEKGVVFSMTFIRKVQVMYLDYYTTSHADDPGHHNTFPLSKLREEAEELITELQSVELPSESTPSHLLAFYIYPLGHAFAALGFYHAHMIELVQPPIADIIALHLRMAADLYLKAADTFPVDDELHPYFLSCAVNYSFKCGTPIKDILPLMERIRKSIPETKKIWEHSGTYSRLQKTLDNTLRIEDQMRESLRKGEFTLEDAVIPQLLPEDGKP